MTAEVATGTVRLLVHFANDEMRDCLDAIDDEFVSTGSYLVPTVEALAAAICRAVESRPGHDGVVDELTVTYPSHWGNARRAVLEAAARRTANDARAVPIALAVPGPVDAVGWTVVECAETSTTVVAVRRDTRGESKIVGCALAPRTGTLDLGADPGQVSVIDRLIGEVGAIVFVVGVSADTVADALARCAGRDVRVVPQAALVACPEPPRSFSATAESDPIAPTSWLDRVPAQEDLARTTRRPRLIGAALTVVGLLVVAASAISVQQVWGSDPPRDAAPLRRVETGRLSTELPTSWQVRDDRRGRLELVPDDGQEGRIVLVPTDLPDGSGRDAVVRGLERKIGERGTEGPFSDFAADVEFGGRLSVGYVESPVDGSRVRWFVLVEDDVQVSVGCQYRGVAWEAIAAVCEQTVRAVVVAPSR
ncbi:type VII secretion-associated protein (TIGR03931 family) [Rhodococcus sp. OK519]|nr:type VII secretion-associated protein (TIGR03931 family) [Rhodococcus sp. OK519]